MAVVFMCDGCGRPCGAEAKRLGLAVVRDYCEECAPVIQRYMDGLDDLHDETAAFYRERKEKLIEFYRVQMLDAKFPDDGVA